MSMSFGCLSCVVFTVINAAHGIIIANNTRDPGASSRDRMGQGPNSVNHVAKVWTPASWKSDECNAPILLPGTTVGNPTINPLPLKFQVPTGTINMHNDGAKLWLEGSFGTLTFDLSSQGFDPKIGEFKCNRVEFHPRAQHGFMESKEWEPVAEIITYCDNVEDGGASKVALAVAWRIMDKPRPEFGEQVAAMAKLGFGLGDKRSTGGKHGLILDTASSPSLPAVGQSKSVPGAAFDLNKVYAEEWFGWTPYGKQNLCHYYHYWGSMPYPPCDAALVHWFVADDPAAMEQAQHDAFLAALPKGAQKEKGHRKDFNTIERCITKDTIRCENEPYLVATETTTKAPQMQQVITTTGEEQPPQTTGGVHMDDPWSLHSEGVGDVAASDDA